MKSNSGQFKKGIIPHNKGKIGVSEKTHNLMSLSKIKAKIIPPSRKGKKATEKTKSIMKGRIPWNKSLKMSPRYIEVNRLSHLGFKHSFNTRKKMSEIRRGAKSYQWKGGITSTYFLIRRCFKYRQWRSDVFQRDNYTCTWCLDKKGGNLEADHIKPFALIFHENHIKTLEQALECEEFWNLNNGRTLCVPCHRKTDTWGYKTKKILN